MMNYNSVSQLETQMIHNIKKGVVFHLNHRFNPTLTKPQVFTCLTLSTYSGKVFHCTKIETIYQQSHKILVNICLKYCCYHLFLNDKSILYHTHDVFVNSC